METLIVMSCGKPVPAVKGGAVATLVEYIISENEKQTRMALNVFSVYDVGAADESRKYSKTNFHTIKRNKIIDASDSCIDYVFGKLKHKSGANHYLWKLHVVRKLKRFLLKHDYDRVVFQNSGYLLLALKNKKIAKKYKGKLYYHLHNDIPGTVYVKGVQQCKLILISEYLQAEIVRLCGEKMREQCYVVKNGFNCDLFRQSLSDEEKLTLKRKLGIDDDKKIILYTGRMVVAKGVDKLLDAFVQLNRDDCILLVVGSVNFDSAETSDFEKKLKAQFTKLNSKVIHTGYVPYKDIWKYYKLADIAVLPSVWNEPAGLTMVEACAASVPLITTKSGGIPEYIKDDFAILLERDDNLVDNIALSIAKILENYSYYKNRANIASEYVSRHFSENEFYNEFVKVVQRD